MSVQLISLDDYCVLTFATTSYALKAEKELIDSGAEFIIMPTLREISSSCGLSVKTYPEDLENVKQVLTEQRVPIEGIYKVKKEDKNNLVTKLE